MNTEERILAELERINAGELFRDKVTVCHIGRHCQYKQIIQFDKHVLTTCLSVVPCDGAIDSPITIYKR